MSKRLFCAMMAVGHAGLMVMFAIDRNYLVYMFAAAVLFAAWCELWISELEGSNRDA